jgi:malonyl-CoA/methylmalonyl-CoA synthetase
MTFLVQLQENCRVHAGKVAVEFLPPPGRFADTEQVTYGDLEVQVQQTMQYLLSLGVRPGVRVALQLPKCMPFIILHLAIMRLGAISLPLNPAYPHRELAYFLRDAGAQLLFADGDKRPELATMRAELDLPALEQIVYLDPTNHDPFPPEGEDALSGSPLPAIPTDPDQTALMIYTSGTTGRPKGAMITHGNLTANINALHEAWGWQEKDVLLHVLPIFHVHGLVVALHGAFNAGATTLLMPKFEADWSLQTLEERQCTVFMAVPTIHRRLLDAAGAGNADLGHMRLLTSGSDRLPDDLFLRFQETFGHTLLERYGMTETGMNLSNPLHGERRMGSVGLPLPGVEARVVNPETGEEVPAGIVGEVQIRGPHVCKGYWQQPEKTAQAFTADGWLRTGDLGCKAADGYFTLQGRAKDLIITGGMNVYPPEVERVLRGHPAVADCAVIGCPDPEWGEQVVALIIPRPEAEVSEKALSEYCREHLAAYKCPRLVQFVEGFPRNALGKVQKAHLREAFCQ